MESKFKPGMHWDNHGGKTGWQIDHIVPLAEAKTLEQAIALNHYKNIQPLWPEENRKKWKSK